MKKTAVILMVVAAIAMAVITVFEALEGSGQSPFRYYTSPWFIALLALVWINLAYYTFKPSFWQRKRLSLAVTHFGFLLILTGSFVTWVFGIRGQLFIEEGKTEDAFRIEQPVLEVVREDGERLDHHSFIIEEENRVRSSEVLRTLNPFAAKNRITLEGGAVIEIQDWLEASRVKSEVKEDPEGRGPPALLAALGEETLVIQQDVPSTPQRIPDCRILYECRDPDDESPPDLTRIAGESIEIVPPQGESVVFPVTFPGDEGATRTQGGYTIEILEHHPNFKMGTQPNPDDPPLNPAVRLKVEGPGESKTLYSFALVEFHGNQLSDGTEVRYHRPGAGRALLLVSRGPERLEAYLSATGEAQPFSVEEPLVLDSGVTLKPVSLWAGSTNVHRVVWDPRGMGPPAYKVQIGEGGEPVWMSRELGVAASIDGRTLARISNAFGLGFSVTLDDAVAEYWPASSIPRAFYSIVKVAYPPGTEPRPDRIETNAPLLCNGFRLYQSDIDKKAPYRYSVFSVARDPGVPWVTAGFVLMTIGFLWLYVSRFILKPIRLRRAEKGEAA